MKKLILDKIRMLSGVNLLFDIPWKDLTTLGVGGLTEYIVQPTNIDSLRKLILFCYENDMSYFIIGGGSNIIGSDSSIGKLVIKLPKDCMDEFVCAGNNVNVGATLSNKSFVKKALEHGFGGISPLAFIPGQIGGSLRMNAGAHGCTISDYLIEIHCLNFKGEHLVIAKDDIEWDYRSSSIHSDYIITGAVFKLPKVDMKNENITLDKLMTKRKETNAKGRNAGCVFKNPSPSTPAGKLIDMCGCKGLSVGDAVVSTEHANFIVNNGNATETDFLELAIKIKRIVFEKTGIYLQPEVEFANDLSFESLNSITSTVAVLKGGTSSEREVSLESGKAVANALRSAGYNVLEVDIQALEITPEMYKADIVFPVLHGGFGESGELQKLMEVAGIEFVGCGSEACEIIMDKISTKKVMEEYGIKGAKDIVLVGKDYKFPNELSLPVVTKPPRDGSSFGVSLVTTLDEWKKALDFSYKYDDRILVEEYIDGIELTVGVIDGEPLPAVEIDYPGEMYDFDAKYTHEKGETYYHCPPKNISEDLHKQCQDIAVSFYNAVKARDVTRVDLMVKDSGEIYVLEGNNLPGFTASSLLPKSAQEAGKSFVELCAQLALCAIKRKKRKS